MGTRSTELLRRLLAPAAVAAGVATFLVPIGRSEPRRSVANADSLVGVVVMENALGDLDANGRINVLDLLRLRDIVLGAGDPPSAYELAEGDLDGDGDRDPADLDYLRDVVLRARPAPYVIGPAGGTVSGNDGRTTFTIPAGVYSVVKRFAVDDYPLESFIEDLGSDPATWGSGVQFMAGASLTILNPTDEDSSLGRYLGMTEQVPEGAVIDTTTPNIVMNVVEGIDGAPRLRMFDALRPMPGPGGLSLGFQSPPPVALTLAAPVLIDPVTLRDSVITVPQLEPGMPVAVYGTGWSSADLDRYEILWVGPDTASSNVDLVATDDRSRYSKTRGLVTNVPLVGSGTYSVSVRDRQMPLTSNALTLDVADFAGVPHPDDKSALLARLDTLTARLTELRDEPILVEQFPNQRAAVDRKLQEMQALRDSVAATPVDSLDQQALADLLRLLANWDGAPATKLPPALGGFAPSAGGCPSGGADACDKKYGKRLIWNGTWAQMSSRRFILGQISKSTFVKEQRLYKNLHNENVQKHNDCKQCCKAEEANRRAFKDFVQKDSKGRIKVICVHIECNKVTMRSDTGKHVFLSPPSGASPASLRGNSVAVDFDSTFVLDNLGGLIVSIKDSPLPGNEAIMADDGTAIIPFNILTGDVVLSGYDPATGLFDEEVARFHVSSDESHLVGIVFDPDTTSVRHVLPFDQYAEDQVAPGRARHEFSIYVPGSAVGRTVRFGFRGAEAMTYWLQDPSGAFVVRDSLASCRRVDSFMVPSAGTYRVTVTPGFTGGDGAFAVGTSLAPDPATPYLCGTLNASDSLVAGRYDYRVLDTMTLGASGRLALGAGVRVEFGPGGSIVSNGVVTGAGSPGLPITIGPLGGSSGPLSRSTPLERGENPVTRRR